MGRRKYHREAVKKNAVALVFEGYRTETVARKMNVHPGTVRLWVKQYEDEVDEVMARRRTEEERMREASARLPEVEEKYKKAIKLLGEKELELEILRELVKKKYPDWKPHKSGSIEDIL